MYNIPPYLALNRFDSLLSIVPTIIYPRHSLSQYFDTVYHPFSNTNTNTYTQ
jgi:hypothetical protein